VLQAIDEMIDQMGTSITAVAQLITQSLLRVYSICWNNDHANLALMDPELRQKSLACRDKFLPDLNRMRQIHERTLTLVGIVREEVEFAVVGVQTQEECIAQKMKEAKAMGAFFDLCDLEDNGEDATSEEKTLSPRAHASSLANLKQVKQEPGTKPAAQQRAYGVASGVAATGPVSRNVAPNSLHPGTALVAPPGFSGASNHHPSATFFQNYPSSNTQQHGPPARASNHRPSATFFQNNTTTRNTQQRGQPQWPAVAPYPWPYGNI
jgi:hypothetical protein